MRSFSDYHPAAVFFSIISCALVVMFSTNPVFILLSLAGAVCLWLAREGLNDAKSHLFCLVLLAAVPLINMLFSHNGVTVLFVLNNNPVTLESLVYGLFSAVMLVSVLYWFRSFSRMMTSDRLMYLLGKLSPKLALVFSMALRFIPHFGRQAEKVDSAQKVLGLYREDNIVDTVKGKLNVFSILVTWGLENGIITADSMAARGYGTGRRTTYHQYRFRRGDGILMAVTAVLLGIVIYGMAAGHTDYSYYPAMGKIALSPLSAAAYISYGIMVFIPSFIEIEVSLRWRSLRSSI